MKLIQSKRYNVQSGRMSSMYIRVRYHIIKRRFTEWRLGDNSRIYHSWCLDDALLFLLSYLRMSITTVVITAARNTKPPNTPKAITAPKFSLAWWVPLGCSALATRKGPDGSGTPAPIPACAWSTPLPDISLSCGWSLPASLSTDEGDVGLFRPILGLFETVSLTVAGSSAVLGTFLDDTKVVLVVAVLVAVLILGVRYVRVFGVDGRVVARVGELATRDSSVKVNSYIEYTHIAHRHVLFPKYSN